MLGSFLALLSSAVGGTSMAATRHLAAYADPFTIGALRFAGAALLLLPLALQQRAAFPRRSDMGQAVGLALLMFGIFPVLMNAALVFTTAARGALALSATPLLTIMIGAALGTERMAARKVGGVLLAMAGVAIGLAGGLATMPAQAWRGDLLMLGAAVCMAIYNIASGPLIARSSALAFATVGMAVGGLALTPLAIAAGGVSAIAAFDQTSWLVMIYLSAIGGAVGYGLWAMALGHTTPTLVAISVPVNPLAAGLAAAWLLGEPITLALLVGLVMVLAGILIAARAPATSVG